MKWGWLWRRGRFEERMDAEMRFHVESQIGEYRRQGLSRAEAERRARLEFGTVELAKDECRDERPAEWLENTLRDVRYAGRSLRRSPGFAAAAALTLALGIGANAAIFSVAHGVLWKALPYPEAERIYSVEVVIPERGAGATLPVTIQSYLMWRKAETAFSEMAVLRPWEVNLTEDGEPERLGGAYVSANFFSLLGVPMALGRGFDASEEQAGRERVVVISDGLWRRRYGGDRSVVGRSIAIGGTNHVVVGVASPLLLTPSGTQLHASLPFFGPRVEVWKPIAPTKRELESESWDHGMLVRLRRGESAERGRAQLEALLNGMIRSEHPEVKVQLRTRLVPIREVYAGRVRLRLLLTLGAAVLLLLTACTNLANLFLARVASRAGEYATRIALGAGRKRIVSQMLAETTIPALAGGAAGLVLAGYGARLLAEYGPGDVRVLYSAGMNGAVLLFAVAASVATGIACAVFPAWQVWRRETAEGMREAGRSGGGGRATRSREVLVGVQVALGTALLASAGLLLHSFVKVIAADRGYEVERVLAVDLSLFGPGQNAAVFYRELSENTRRLPGVVAAGAINDLPAVAGSSGASRTIFHAADTNFENTVMQRPVAMIRSVTAGYFAASGTRLRAGRYLNDQEAAPVALVSESLARRLWPGESAEAAVGRVVRQGRVTGPAITVVGVMQDVRPGGAEGEMPPMIYRPYPQWASGPATLVVRTAQDPAAVAPAVRMEIRKLNANLPIPSMRTMREIVSSSVAERRFQMALTMLFGIVALLLGAVGVYGVVSYAVACRTRDIGLRMALGARRGDVMRWVMGSGMRPVAAGLVCGLASAMGLATALRRLLYGIGPADPTALAGVVAVLLATSIAACWIPARRAARMDPMTALRHE